jgi:hypothetical protein
MKEALSTQHSALSEEQKTLTAKFAKVAQRSPRKSLYHQASTVSATH